MFTHTTKYLQIVMSLLIIISKLWNICFHPTRKCRLVRLSRWLAIFCVHIIWIYKNPCLKWQWKTMLNLFWAFLVLSILILKCGGMILLIFSFNILKLWWWFIEVSLGRTTLGFISCCHGLNSSKMEFI